MKLEFIDRHTELEKLQSLSSKIEPTLAIIYGRRRCGKSRLLQQLPQAKTVYFLADQSDASLQRQAFATRVSSVLPGFGAAQYGSWQAVFESLRARLSERKSEMLTLVLDEFPYLLAETPTLSSILQRIVDEGGLGAHLVLCGSSQRMMQGLVLDQSAPLYGRAREVLKIRPLKFGWISDALGVKDAEAVVQYSVWGGVPRYWELAAEFTNQEEALRQLVFDRDGILHSEPRRLLLDDMRTDTQPHSLLATIGSGANRVSEIGARLQRTAIGVMRPLKVLIELGMVRRDVPFGELEKNSKRTLYSISEPFLRFWYRFVYPNLSLLEQESYDVVMKQWRESTDQYVGGIWEDLARESVSHLAIGGIRWKPAGRFWGKNLPEIDIVAESLDGGSILLGEAKWGETDSTQHCERLNAIAADYFFAKGKKIITACWTGRPKGRSMKGIFVSVNDVLKALR